MSADTPRVALVHDWLTGMRGGEKVLERIARHFPEAPIYTLFHFAGSVSEELESHPIRTTYLQRAPGLRRHYRRYLPFFPRAIESFDLSGYDLIVSSSHCVAKGVISGPGAQHICYCHTPVRYAWDQEKAYFPKQTGPVAWLRGRELARLRRWDVATADRVDRFVANSTFVAGRIERYYGRQAEVIHPPVDTDFFRPAEQENRGGYALAVSLAPYKRIDLAIEACRRLGLELRLVGEGPERERLARRAGEGVRFLGRVDARELRRLYREAACFVQPGVEDFGISPVEALACGCPVVAAGRGGVLDIVTDGVHGVLYDPAGEDAAGADASDSAGPLITAIDKCRRVRFNLLNLRERAEAFSVDRFDRQLVELLGTSRASVASVARATKERSAR